jgi:hypothetical protein
VSVSYFYAYFAILPEAAVTEVVRATDGVMFFSLDPEGWLDDLHARLSGAQFVTPDLMSKVVAYTCARIAMPNGSARLGQINRLIEAQAWTDAALALLALALPHWKPRRLVYEDGAWLCSLSKQWNLPDWLGDCAEARHESLPLAVLNAMMEADRCDTPPARRVAGSVPQCRAEAGPPVEIMCCDNFA